MISREQPLLHHIFTFKNIIHVSVYLLSHILIFAIAQNHIKIEDGRAKCKQTNVSPSSQYYISIFTPSKVMQTSFLHKATIENTNLRVSKSFEMKARCIYVVNKPSFRCKTFK